MKDARLAELQFLARLEREGMIHFTHVDGADPEVRIAIHLLAGGLVNDATAIRSHDDRESEPFFVDSGTFPPPMHYRDRLHYDRWSLIGKLHRKQPVDIYATHASAVRRAELEQAIQRDRLKDKFGILFDGRYANRDLQIALWNASSSEPVSVAFLDMNGLKAINDTVSHEAGDEAITVFSEVIAAGIAERGEAYNVGGDEVVIVLPKTALDMSAKLLDSIMKGISGRTVRGHALSAAAGLAVATDPALSPEALRNRADELQYRAKERSKATSDRFGALAVEGRDLLEYRRQ